MYIGKASVQRGTDKAKAEEYLIDCEDLTIADGLLSVELSGTESKSTSMVEKKVDNLYENGDGTFYLVNLEYESVDGKPIKETAIQEAKDFGAAYNATTSKVKAECIKSIKETLIMGVVREVINEIKD